MNIRNDERTHGQGQKSRARLRELAAFSLASLLALAGQVRAEDPQNLEFRGTLVTPPPCSLGGDETLYVDFGDKVRIKKVETGIYREVLKTDLQCEESSLAWQLTLRVSGTPAAFDADGATVVSAQQADLGVKLYADGEPLALDRVLKVNAAALPVLEAVLVSRAGTEPEEGPFTARATLRAEYQ